MTRTTLSALFLGAATFANATTYTDSSNDLFDNGFAHLDITSMAVTNTATDISFQFSLRGSPVATDWGKYMVIIDSRAGGDITSNGWARLISQTTGADSWLGGWVDSGNGLENRTWNGSGWQLDGATYNSTPGLSVSKDATSVTFTTTLASLGLVGGQILFFDAFTSGGGGGDGAVDSAGNPGMQITDWGVHSDAHNLTYQVTPVPEPGSMLALVSGFGLLALRRRK